MNDDLNNTHPGLIDWIRNGERGASSEAIVNHLAHHPIARTFWCGSHPVDPGDLRRCVLLLDAVPTLRPLMPRMADVSPEWAALVARWDELEASLRREMADRSDYGAPDTYALMRPVLMGAKQTPRSQPIVDHDDDAEVYMLSSAEAECSDDDCGWTTQGTSKETLEAFLRHVQDEHRPGAKP